MAHYFRIFNTARQIRLSRPTSYKKRNGSRSPANTAILPFTIKKAWGFPDSSETANSNSNNSSLLGCGIGPETNKDLSHVQSVEQKVNQAIRIIRHLCGAKWCETAQSQMALHVAWISSKMSYSLPLLHGLVLPASTERRLHLLLPRSVQVCLELPRSTSNDLVYA